jgi:hypothetical protein
MPKTTRARHRAAGRRAGSKKRRRETVSLIVRIPPPALARLKAVAAVRRLTPASSPSPFASTSAISTASSAGESVTAFN